MENDRDPQSEASLIGHIREIGMLWVLSKSAYIPDPTDRRHQLLEKPPPSRSVCYPPDTLSTAVATTPPTIHPSHSLPILSPTKHNQQETGSQSMILGLRGLSGLQKTKLQ